MSIPRYEKLVAHPPFRDYVAGLSNEAACAFIVGIMTTQTQPPEIVMEPVRRRWGLSQLHALLGVIRDGEAGMPPTSGSERKSAAFTVPLVPDAVRCLVDAFREGGWRDDVSDPTLNFDADAGSVLVTWIER